MGENILSGVISGIISGFFLILIQQLLIPRDKSAVNDRTIKSIETSRVVYKEKIEKISTNTSTNKNSDDNSIIIIAVLFAMVLAVGAYIKYIDIVHFIIIATSLAIGVMAIGMACYCVKKGIRFKQDLNIMLCSNMLALVAVPFLIWKTKNAIEQRGIDIEFLRRQSLKTNGFINSSDFPATMFLAYQIIGLLLVTLYMLIVLISNIYLISLINLNLGSKAWKLWNLINRKTYRFFSKSIGAIFIEMFFLIIAYLMVSGIILDLITK